MAIVVIYHGQDNARSRRRARREAKREQAAQDAALARLVIKTLSGCSERVVRAISQDKPVAREKPEQPPRRNRRWYAGPRGNEVTCRGKEKRQRRPGPCV